MSLSVPITGEKFKVNKCSFHRYREQAGGFQWGEGRGRGNIGVREKKGYYRSQHIGKDPGAGNDRGRKEKEQQRMRWLDSITDSTDKNLSKLREVVKDREATLQPRGRTESDTIQQLNNDK